MSANLIYNLLRAFHILAVIAWMAGLLYLPRLFFYHNKATLGYSEICSTPPSRPWSAGSTGRS